MIDIHVHALECMPACVSTCATVCLEPRGEHAGVSFLPPFRFRGASSGVRFAIKCLCPLSHLTGPSSLALVNGHQMTFKAGGSGWGAGLLCLSLAGSLGGHSLLWCHRVFTGGGGEGPHPGLLGACKTPSADNHKCPRLPGD